MKRLYVQWVLLLILFCNSLHAQDTQGIDLLAALFLKQTKLPGLSIAVAKEGKVIYAKGFGFSNLEDQLPVRPSTRIRTASVAKVLTVTALGRLATEGLVDFDAPIKKYIPYINENYARLTVRQLAGHTSGLKHRPSGKGYQNKDYNTIRETVEIINGPLLFEPGTDYRYSTAAFNLLAAVIEGASGISYAEYMKTRVFKPLKMGQTAPENINELTSEDAKIYSLKKDKLKRVKPNNGSYKVPGAAIRSTPSDLVKLTNAYSDQGFISKEVVKEMFASNSLLNGEKTNVGIAWRSSVDVFGNNVIEHAGSWRGARTVLVYYPEEEMSISLMINAECQVLIEETAHIFAQFFRDEKESTSKISLNEKVEVLHNSKEGKKQYNGNLSINSGLGTLLVESDDYLKSNEVIQLQNGFALCTQYGLFFMEIDADKNPEGKVYAYFTMNEKSPKEEAPLLEFKATE